ncbi:hypothetical protein OC846_003961 [Tilletia horrida]|uniref:RING-type E3 ubiquitin transferase n=1 Tax=Tilletia horrida TaxID=155126 RepID=A0AAN6GPL2_9BASI|nr:hypothetical protein OC846_003961 [Tilletia horrida]
MSSNNSGSSSNRGGSNSRGRGRGGGGGGGAGGRRAAFGGNITSSSSSQPSSNSNNRRTGKGKAAAKDRDEEEEQPSHSSSAQRAAESHAASAAAAVIKADAEATAADPDAEYCFICAEPIIFYSLAPCDHRTCHICAIRLRALYKKMECTFCKTPSDRLIFTTSPDKLFAQFLPTDIPFSDSKLSISFETEEAYERTLVLLRYNCPHPNCEVASAGWSDLKHHTKRDHSRLLCDLCIKHKKIFAHEHELHTSQSLSAHISKDHGRCEYCRENFYSDDELYVHMRDNHEQCHICKARGGEAERWKYYQDYDMLQKHFRDDHYLCMNKDCLEKRFVVFESEMDFKAHRLAEHANELSSRQRREALRVDAHFTYDDNGSGSAPVQHHVPGAPPPAQRRAGARANLGGAGAESRRANFGGSLTSSTVESSSNSAQESDAAREARIFNRAANILGVSTASDDSRLIALQSACQAFTASQSSARDLVLTVLSLVASDADRAGSVISVLVGSGSGAGEKGLFEEDEKRSEVLTQWNAIRMERTQFPSLNGGPHSDSSTPTTSQLSNAMARTQIRNIKSTSSQHSSRVWENVERAATGQAPGLGRYGLAASSSGGARGYLARSLNNFPALGLAPANQGSVSVPGSARHAAAASASVRSSAVARTGGSSWGGGAGATTSSSSSSAAGKKPVVPLSVHVSSAGGGSGSGNGPSRSAFNNSSAFPSLPTNSSAAALAAQKRALFADRGGSAKGKSPTTPSAEWGASSSSSSSTPVMSRGGSGPGNGPLGESEGGATDGAGAGAGKKKKGKGVVLLSMGGVQRG